MNKTTVLITGANRGVGFATARAVAARGAHIVLAVRDVTSGQEAATRICAEHKHATAEVLQLDLASLDSVRTFANNYAQSGKPLHALINNAGPIFANAKLAFTQDGFEMFFGVNHLGHFLLTNLLLPVLQNSAPSRIITVSSVLHKRAKDFDWQNLRGEKSYDQSAFYNRTKLANLWFSYALAKRLEGTGITSLAVCPGFVPQTLMVGKTGFSKLMFQVLDKMPFARKPHEAGEDIAKLALDLALQNTTAKFFSYGQESVSSDLSYDKNLQEKLWTLSEQLVGI